MADRLDATGRSDARKGRGAAVLAAAAFVLLGTANAHAQMLDSLSPETITNLAVIGLTIGAAMIAGVWLIREKAALAAENDQLRANLADVRAEADMRAALLAANDQRIVAWPGKGAPEIVGSLPRDLAAPSDPKRFLAFSEWLAPADAAALSRDVDRLKAKAEPFRRELTLGTDALEVTGRTAGAMALLRFGQLSGARAELVHLRGEHERTLATIETMQALFDHAPMPVWLRDDTGELVFANTAFLTAVEAASLDDAAQRKLELFTSHDRQAMAAEVKRGGVFRDRLTAVVDADRRTFQVVDTAGPGGHAGLAVDVSAVEAVRLELRETIRSHSETLDHLTTAVARFNEKTQLTYHNAAFQKLFDLSGVYLDTAPDHVAILDQLRTRGILPEDRPLRDVKNEIMAAYRATQPTDAIWHLADGRTLRVFASPEPQGGATWVFEDLTEKFELESRLNALVRLQGETLDYLTESVAVFGQDGRLRLSNPSFAETFGLSPDFLAAKPHIRAFGSAGTIAIRSDSDGIGWTIFANAVTAFEEGARETANGEIELSDGSAVTYAIVPLPNGQTMLTFTNVSDARAAERMLRERNDALVEADRVKSEFIQHVNYELRSPLTNIIGFSALLRSVETGPLTERQSEYLDYIATSTSTLLTIVNDILDLATIDAGIMDLDLSEVDIAKTVDHAAEAMRERLRENEIELVVDVSKAPSVFRADGHRVTQILFNLLSNAANFAPSGSAISLRAMRLGEDVVFKVSDEGPGIPASAVDRAFERFEADPAGGRQSGAGLGLSIVKSFVELHGGRVDIAGGPRGGTVVTCRFPLRRNEIGKAAE